METVLSTLHPQVSIEVADASAVGAVRRQAAELCRQEGLDETTSGEASLVATEAATNIIKHAGSGEMLLRRVRSAAGGGVEILALDSGPGMADLAARMQDGTTTAGSYGIGLGTMRRLAHAFDIYTAPGKGTAIAMTICAKGRSGAADAWQTAASRSMQLGAVCLPLRGESACGDAWAVAFGPTLATVMVADGLGHGVHAAQASDMATAILAQAPDMLPGALLQDIHLALRATRGAAVALARLDLLSEQVRFAGVGNIAASICTGEMRRQMVSHNGIVGSNIRKIQEFTHDWHANSILLLCSDGLGTRWDLNQYPGLAQCHPSVIAAVLYRDFVRRRDDVTVLVLRENRSQ